MADESYLVDANGGLKNVVVFLEAAQLADIRYSQSHLISACQPERTPSDILL